MTKTSDFDRLIDLASEKSSERRRELLREITDLFLDAPDTYNATVNTHFGEIMGKIAFDLEQQIRVDLAQRLAAESAAPPELIYKLACDEIEVAGPLIERSPVLSEARLLELTKRQSQQHLLAIANRTDVTHAVSSALVRHGDDVVVEGLVKNEQAEISADTMKEVVGRARSNESLQAPLVDREDLPQDLLNDLVNLVSAELKEKILARSSDIDTEKLDKAIKGTGEKFKRKPKKKRAVKSQPEMVVDQLAAEDKLNENALIEFAQHRKIPEFICGLSKLAKIDILTAKNAVMNKNQEGLAIICRALDFDRASFSVFVLAADRTQARTMDDTYGILRSYDRLTPETAQRIMRFWHVRKNVGAPAGQASQARVI